LNIDGGFIVPEEFARPIRENIDESVREARATRISGGEGIPSNTQSFQFNTVINGGHQVGYHPSEPSPILFNYDVKAESPKPAKPKFKQKEERPKRLIDIN